MGQYKKQHGTSVSSGQQNDKLNLNPGGRFTFDGKAGKNKKIKKMIKNKHMFVI